MNIQDEIRKCVVFIGYRVANGTFRFAGSGFYYGKDDPASGTADPVYLVTAKHVISGIKKLGMTEVWARLNLKDGDSQWLSCTIDQWFTHPTDSSVDVAILKAGIAQQFDHLAYPMSRRLTEDVIKKNSIGLGDEVFIVGLFRHHHGNKRNIPIVRVGNVASFSEERVITQEFGEMDAYLIEARSIGGLSGSPVLVNLGIVRRIDGKIQYATTGHIHYLLGMIHGHFDVVATSSDVAKRTADEITNAQINTGIAIVTPSHRVDELISEYEKQLASPPTRQADANV